MERRCRAEPFTAGEIFLPLVFFAADEKIFMAGGLVLLSAAAVIFIFEILRRLPQELLNALYLFMLIACAWMGWRFLHLAPYWILSLHLAVPAGARNFTAAQKKRPFFAGVKKYFRRRAGEFVFAAFFFAVFSAACLGGRRFLPSDGIWAAAVLFLLFFETARARLQEIFK